MSLEPLEQLKTFLEKSEEPLILLPENPDGDAVGAAWGLFFFLKNKGVSPTIAFSGELPQKTAFLPRPEKILPGITGARDFVLSFDTSRNKIKNIRSEQLGNQFNIFVTPEKGTVNPRDFSFILAKFKYDLIIVINCPDLESLGKVYEENPDLFFEVPVINIDHKSNNDNFGQINLVDVTASSCSEIIYGLLENINESLADEKIAECLLSGIILATDRFQKKNTTPKTFHLAAKLMDKGADQQKIVRWLYKTQPLSILKLWGRAMANLRWEENFGLIWSSISVEDFVQSRSDQKSIPTILEKLQENYSDGKLFMLIWNDTPHSSIALITSPDKELLSELNAFLGGIINSKNLEIRSDFNNLEMAGEKIQEKIAYFFNHR